MTSLSSLSCLTVVVLLCFSSIISIHAFVVSPDTATTKRTTSTQILALSRRDVVFGAVMFAGTASGLTQNAPEAHASFSAYTHREQDWQERSTKGEIQYSTARSLRKQLREIVPMNAESSRVFCPNGPSAAVSPLMENKCSDALAMPSVFGRTQDVVGNSIPGSAKFGSTSNMVGVDTSLNTQAAVGGFPKYK